MTRPTTGFVCPAVRGGSDRVATGLGLGSCNLTKMRLLGQEGDERSSEQLGDAEPLRRAGLSPIAKARTPPVRVMSSCTMAKAHKPNDRVRVRVRFTVKRIVSVRSGCRTL